MATKELPLTFGPPGSTRRTALLPPELSLLVLDTLASPGLFALVHFITKALKPQSRGSSASPDDIKRPVVLVGVAEGEAGWDGLLRKQGVQISTENAETSFAFVDASPWLRQLSISAEPSSASLEDLARSVEEATDRLSKPDAAPPLILVDDVLALLWAGHSIAAVKSLCSSLDKLRFERRTSTILLAHADLTTSSRSVSSIEADDEILVRSSIESSDVILRLRGLGPDTGEMTILRGPTYLDDPDLPVTKGGATTQYRIADNSVTYVTKGLDRGFI